MGDPFHDQTVTHAQPITATPIRRRRWPAELGITLAGAAVYFGVRVVVEGGRDAAIANAERLLRVERALGIDIEHTAQAWVIDREPLRVLGNLSYVWLHWPLLITVLITLFVLDRARFHHLRTTMFWSGAIGLLIFATIPTAPPRFMPGFVGTVSDDARRHYLDYPLSWTNQFAALPSFHVGWTLVACLALAGLVRHRLGKAVVLLPAVLVALSVVTTGNHYVIDALLGTIIAASAYLLTAGARDREAAAMSDDRAAAIIPQDDAHRPNGRYRRTPCPSTSMPPTTQPPRPTRRGRQAPTTPFATDR